jgi:hypothetical protein
MIARKTNKPKRLQGSRCTSISLRRITYEPIGLGVTPALKIYSYGNMACKLLTKILKKACLAPLVHRFWCFFQISFQHGKIAWSQAIPSYRGFIVSLYSLYTLYIIIIYEVFVKIGRAVFEFITTNTNNNCRIHNV